MSTGYQIQDQFGTYFITPTIVDWVDVLTHKRYKDIIIDSLKHCIEKKGLRVYGYVIMTNHLHLIVNSEHGKLSDTIRDFKKFTAHSILEEIAIKDSRREWLLHRFEWNAAQNQRSSSNQFWTHENHAEFVATGDFFRQKLNYIHQNPVRAGWVEREEDYLFSSARALMTQATGQIPLSYWF